VRVAAVGVAASLALVTVRRGWWRPALLGGAATVTLGLAVAAPPIAVDAYPTTYVRPAVPDTAVLLWGRHRCARFSAYVFFSALALRRLVTGSWALVVFAGASVLVLQTPAAGRAWPRLVAGGRSSTRGTSSST